MTTALQHLCGNYIAVVGCLSAVFRAGAGLGPLVGVEFGLADTHNVWGNFQTCLLYTSDAADDTASV